MPPTLTDGEGQHKNSRKIKRLRDASCMRKRETKQDRWGRQRGGRKARWDKLDRQPSALKSRLRLVNSAAAGRGVDDQARLDAVEEAFAFVDAAGITAAVAAAAGTGLTSAGASGGGGDGSRGDARAEGDPHADIRNGGATGTTAGNIGEDGGVGVGVEVDAVAETGVRRPVYPGRLAPQERNGLPPPSPTPATANGGYGGMSGEPVTPAAAALSATAMPKTPSSVGTGIRSSSSSSSSSGISSGRTKASGGSAGRRSSLRSPGGLSRASSIGSGSGGLGRGSYRGSPPPLHRRLSSPSGTVSVKKTQKQRQAGAGAMRRGSGSGSGSAMKKKQASSRSESEKEAEEQEEVEAATPPPPPSLFESVFKDKLPSLTPRKAPPATPRLSRDSIVHAIFQSLFGKRKVRSGPRERYGGDWDDVDEDDEEDENQEEEVDESWIKNGINLTLFNSKAVDFACRSTAGADLLHQYVDGNAVFRLVTDLRFEDPRVPSPRLMIIKAVYENCAHLRLPTLRALAHASHDHLMRTRELEDWAARTGVDIGEAAAAAVADGISKSSGGEGGGGLGGRVRVTGRDQSQTLGELLLFVLETFPRFFLGMAPPDEAAGQQQVMEQGGFEAGFSVDGGGNGHGYGHGEGFAPKAEGGAGGSGFNNNQEGWNGGQALQQQVEADAMAGFALPNAADALDSSMDPPFDPSLEAAAAAANQCRSPTPTPYQPPPSPTLPTAAAEAVSSPNARNSASSESASPGGDTPENDPSVPRGQGVTGGGTSDDDGASIGANLDCSEGDTDNTGRLTGGEGAVVGSPGDGGPVGGRAIANSPASIGGDPAPASDGSVPAWNSLAMSSPSPAKKLEQQPGAGNKQEPPWSPAWATAGMRILEENPRGNSGGGEQGGRAVHGGVSSGGGVWDQGMASKDLVWGASGAETSADTEESDVDGDMPATPDAGASAARALRFTTQGEGDGVDTAAAPSAVFEGGAGARGFAGDLFGAGRDLSRESPSGAPTAAAAAIGPPLLLVGGESEARGFGLDEWPTAEESKSSTPERRSSAPGPAEASRDAPTSLIAAGVAASEGQDTVAQEQRPPLPATPTRTGYAASTGAPGVPMPEEIDLPSAALKEATRSLCNLYASHGAPAAGAEAAAAADAPERLQPLAVAGSALCNLWPPSSALLLRRLVGTWPTGSARREVAYLRLVAGVACASPPLGVVCPGSRVPLMLFRRLAKCITSANTKVAQEAVFLVQADVILMAYLAPDRRLMDLVTNALCANREHWSADVRNASDQTFDLMLDYL
eukprot:g17902.t1